MTGNHKHVAAGLFAAVLAGLIPGTAGPPRSITNATSPAIMIPPAVPDAIAQAIESGDSTVGLELQLVSPLALRQLERAVTDAGGQIVVEEGTHVSVKVPAADIETVATSAAVVAVGVNQQLQLDEPQIAATTQALNAVDASQLAAISLDPIGVAGFRTTAQSFGRNVVVAVIDSGIDPGHPDLARTPDGRAKVIDWKDFTSEGYVDTPHTVSWGTTYSAPGNKRYTLPPRPASSNQARFGYWDEFNVAGLLNRDLDRNGQQTDRFGVLLVDANRTGVYDTVYVDTNNDGDFTDEQAQTSFRFGGQMSRLGKSRDSSSNARQLAFVVADVAADGSSVILGFDGNGHGTQVAGVLGAYSSSGYTGVAPGVQIMALKALNSSGVGDWFAIKQAIRYAAQNGAQIINISVGGLAAAASKFDATASEWLNQIAREYGVLIILAADNSGPGLSSGSTLGNPSEVMAVGAYYSPDMWKRDFGVVVPHESIWSLSGMGPRSDGSYVPSLVAPGGSPAPSPFWLNPTGYTTAIGTSIAAPHASGVAALLMEAGQASGTNHDRLSVKRALELGARPIPGFGVFEQGYGLISPTAAFKHLQKINSVPVLMARTAEGNGGVLARSYQPGNTSFWLTNLDTELTRVGIFSAAPWIRPERTSLTLPPATARQLPIRLDPPQTPGVHSAFVQVTHPEKYGPSLSIPVTHVRSIQLAKQPDAKFSTRESLEVGRYQRFFFEVGPGQQRLDVTARVLLNEQNAVQGTVQVHLFRPDGQALHTSKIGLDGAGLTALVNVEDPIEGVWEVVVTAIPDSRGTNLHAAYTLDVQTGSGALQGGPLKLTMPAGGTTTIPLKIVNTYGAFTGRVEAVGLSRIESATPWNLGRSWQVEKGTQNLVEDFTLKEFTSLMRVEISNPIPNDVDLNLYLYYLDPQQGWEIRGQSLTAGSSREAIEVTNLPAGRYQTLAVVKGSTPPALQYQYRRLMAVEGYHLKVSDQVLKRERNATWTPTLTIQAPNTPGRYIGQILLKDTENNRVLGWYPFEVSVGQPVLSIEPMVAQLIQGKPSTVTFEIRDTRTGKLTDATITVNGRRYASRNGRISIPVVAEGTEHTLTVEADLPDYQFVRKQVTLPVRQSWGLHPLGIDLNQEISLWRRKVMSQLP